MNFNPYDYPKTYPIASGWRLVQNLVGLVFFASGLLGIWYFGFSPFLKDTKLAMILAGISSIFTLTGIYFFLSAQMTKLVLTSDSIEVHSLWAMRSLKREDIGGRRRSLEADNSKRIVLIAKQNESELEIPELLETDLAATVYANGLFDYAAPKVYHVKVMDRQSTRGRRNVIWYVKVDSWGPISESQDEPGRYQIYQDLKPGDCACYLHAGALGFPRYEVLPCY